MFTFQLELILQDLTLEGHFIVQGLFRRPANKASFYGLGEGKQSQLE